jgi:hypothetical protein
VGRFRKRRASDKSIWSRSFRSSSGFAPTVSPSSWRKVEQKEDQVFRVARVRRGLEEAERGLCHPIERRPAPRRDRLAWREATPPPRRSAGYLCVQSNPCGQQPDHAPIEPRMHPVLIESISCSDSDPSGGWSSNLVVRFDPSRQHRRLGASPARERSRHATMKRDHELHRFIMFRLEIEPAWPILSRCQGSIPQKFKEGRSSPDMRNWPRMRGQAKCLLT